MMARAKRIYILIVKVNTLFSFFSSRCFLKEIENMFFVFLSSYRNTRKSLGELEEVVEEKFLVLPNFHSCFYNSINTVHVFYFLNIDHLRWAEVAPVQHDPVLVVVGVLVSDVKSVNYDLIECVSRVVDVERLLSGPSHRLEHHGPAW